MRHKSLYVVIIPICAIFFYSCELGTNQDEVIFHTDQKEFNAQELELLSLTLELNTHISSINPDELYTYIENQNVDLFLSTINFPKEKYERIQYLIEVKASSYEKGDYDFLERSNQDLLRCHEGNKEMDLMKKVKRHFKNVSENPFLFKKLDLLKQSEKFYNLKISYSENDDKDGFWDSKCSWKASACTVVAAATATACGAFAPLCFIAGASLCYCEFCEGDFVDENC